MLPLKEFTLLVTNLFSFNFYQLSAFSNFKNLIYFYLTPTLL